MATSQIQIDVGADTGSAIAQVKALKSFIEKQKADIKVGIDRVGVSRKEIERGIARPIRRTLARERFKINVDVDRRSLRGLAGRINRELARERLELKTRADTTEARKRIDEFRTAQEAKELNVDVDANVGAASAKLAALQAQANSIRTTIDVDRALFGAGMVPGQRALPAPRPGQRTFFATPGVTSRSFEQRFGDTVRPVPSRGPEGEQRTLALLGGGPRFGRPGSFADEMDFDIGQDSLRALDRFNKKAKVSRSRISGLGLGFRRTRPIIRDFNRDLNTGIPTYIALNRQVRLLKRRISATGRPFESIRVLFGSTIRQAKQLRAVFAALTDPTLLSLIGGGLGLVGFTAAAGGAAAAAGFVEFRMAQLENAAKGLGGTIGGFTAVQIENMAENMAARFVPGAQDAREAMVTIASGTNLAGNEFKRATILAQDLAASFGTDLSDAASLVVDIFQDPVSALESLNESQVRISKSAQDQIRVLVEQGQEAKAASLLYEAVTERISGNAENLSETVVGLFKRLAETIVDFFREAAKSGRVLEPLKEDLRELSRLFRQTSNDGEFFRDIINSIGNSMVFLVKHGELILNILTTLIVGKLLKVVVRLFAGMARNAFSAAKGVRELALGLTTAKNPLVRLGKVAGRLTPLFGTILLGSIVAFRDAEVELRGETVKLADVLASNFDSLTGTIGSFVDFSIEGLNMIFDAFNVKLPDIGKIATRIFADVIPTAISDSFNVVSRFIDIIGELIAALGVALVALDKFMTEDFSGAMRTAKTLSDLPGRILDAAQGEGRLTTALFGDETRKRTVKSISNEVTKDLVGEEFGPENLLRPFSPSDLITQGRKEGGESDPDKGELTDKAKAALAIENALEASKKEFNLLKASAREEFIQENLESVAKSAGLTAKELKNLAPEKLEELRKSLGKRFDTKKLRSIEGVMEDINFEIEQLGRGEKAQFIARRMRQIKKSIEGTLDPEQVEKFRELLGNLFDINKVKDNAEEARKQIEKIMDRATENIQDAFAETFADVFRDGVDGFDDFFDKIKDIAIDTAAEIAAVFAQELLGINDLMASIKQNILTGRGSAGTGGGGSAGSVRSGFVGQAQSFIGQFFGLSGQGGLLQQVGTKFAELLGLNVGKGSAALSAQILKKAMDSVGVGFAQNAGVLTNIGARLGFAGDVVAVERATQGTATGLTKRFSGSLGSFLGTATAGIGGFRSGPDVARLHLDRGERLSKEEERAAEIGGGIGGVIGSLFGPWYGALGGAIGAEFGADFQRMILDDPSFESVFKFFDPYSTTFRSFEDAIDLVQNLFKGKKDMRIALRTAETEFRGPGRKAAVESPFGFVGFSAKGGRTAGTPLSGGKGGAVLAQVSKAFAEADKIIADLLDESELPKVKAALQGTRNLRNLETVIQKGEFGQFLAERYVRVFEAIDLAIPEALRKAANTKGVGKSPKEVVKLAIASLQERFARRVKEITQQLTESANNLLRELPRIQQARSGVSNFLFELTGTPQSPLAPRTRLQNAREAFVSTLTRARGGDLQAIQQLPGLGRNFLDISRNLFASSPEFFDRFNFVRNAMQGVDMSLAQEEQRINETLDDIGIEINRGNQQRRRQLDELIEITQEQSDRLEELLSEFETED